MSKKQSPFYKTGISRSPLNNDNDGKSVVTDKNTQSGTNPATKANHASLGRSTRQRKIDDLKGKLTDVKAKTVDLTSTSEKTGSTKEIEHKQRTIIGRKSQAKRIAKRINRKEGREERKAIKKSLKGKENRGERRKQIIDSRQNQYKKRKAINNPTSKVVKKDKKKEIKKNGSNYVGGEF